MRSAMICTPPNISQGWRNSR